MALRTTFQNWIDGLTNDDGSGTTGDIINKAFFDTQMDLIEDELADIETDITDLQASTFLRGYDTTIIKYTDAATVTLQANGQFVNSAYDAMYTVTANTNIGFASNLSSDVGGGEASSTLYYIWGGEDPNGDQEYWITDSASVMPSELSKGVLLRAAIYNDGSSNLVPFIMYGDYYEYVATAIATGSDTLEVFDGALSTTFLDVDCSGVIPAACLRVRVSYICGGVASGFQHYYRCNGDSHSGIVVGRDIYLSGSNGAPGGWYEPNVSSGIYEAKNDASATTRITLVGYYM